MSAKVYSNSNKLALHHVKSEPIDAIPVRSLSSISNNPLPPPTSKPKYSQTMSHSAGTTPIANDLMELNGPNLNTHTYGTMDNEEDDLFPNTNPNSSNPSDRPSMKMPTLKINLQSDNLPPQESKYHQEEHQNIDIETS